LFVLHQLHNRENYYIAEILKRKTENILADDSI